jgi:aspartyl aminopeptidase
MAHGLHPNYQDKHEEGHQPKLHKGLVIKQNANQRYATNAITSFLFREIGNMRAIPTQDFVVRNDMQCGSTIGPKLASGLGIRTVDVGAPQLSMHSIREMCGIDDVLHSYNHFKAFFEEFSLLDGKLLVDDEA